MDFIISLGLDTEFSNLVRRKKSQLGDFIFFFEVELQNIAASQKSVKYKYSNPSILYYIDL